MKPEQLRYDQDTATRYSLPPSTLAFERLTLKLLDHYNDLSQLRGKARLLHDTLITTGVFQSIPTLTSETCPGRPGTYWRAVFMTKSPEVLHGFPRKHYIGSHPANLQCWTQWIDRTRLAIRLNKLIRDIGMTLKHTAALLSRQADHLHPYSASYTLELEQLQ